MATLATITSNGASAAVSVSSAMGFADIRITAPYAATWTLPVVLRSGAGTMLEIAGDNKD